MHKLFGNLVLLAALALVCLWTLETLQPQRPPATHAAAPSSIASVSLHAHQVVRIRQMAPEQYASPEEYTTWAASACSLASLTEVLNAYGRAYRISDVLTVAVRLHAITAELGLLEEGGIARIAESFGFETSWGHQRTLDQVITLAQAGHPVIVSFPPQEAFPSGHLLVVTGGDARQVLLADSSDLNLTNLPRSRFLALWRGYSAAVSPHVALKGGRA